MTNSCILLFSDFFCDWCSSFYNDALLHLKTHVKEIYQASLMFHDSVQGNRVTSKMSDLFKAVGMKESDWDTTGPHHHLMVEDDMNFQSDAVFNKGQDDFVKSNNDTRT